MYNSSAQTQDINNTPTQQVGVNYFITAKNSIPAPKIIHPDNEQWNEDPLGISFSELHRVFSPDYFCEEETNNEHITNERQKRGYFYHAPTNMIPKRPNDLDLLFNAIPLSSTSTLHSKKGFSTNKLPIMRNNQSQNNNNAIHNNEQKLSNTAPNPFPVPVFQSSKAIQVPFVSPTQSNNNNNNNNIKLQSVFQPAMELDVNNISKMNISNTTRKKFDMEAFMKLYVKNPPSNDSKKT